MILFGPLSAVVVAVCYLYVSRNLVGITIKKNYIPIKSVYDLLSSAFTSPANRDPNLDRLVKQGTILCFSVVFTVATSIGLNRSVIRAERAEDSGADWDYDKEMFIWTFRDPFRRNQESGILYYNPSSCSRAS
jgi:hypothetical protein